MKKMLMCCGVLCLTLLLFCGTAMALDVQVTQVNAENAQVEQIAKGDDVAFKVTKSGAEGDKLYLVMIQEGADASANPKPDKDNLYYLNVEAGSAFPLEAYPKDLKADSSYVVYLSDYSADNNGAAKGIAVISAKADSGDSGDSGANPGGVKKGDVNIDDKVNSSDISALVNVIISGRELTDTQKANADVNGDDKVNSSDISALVNLIIRG